jgi:hypothetical protein
MNRKPNSNNKKNKKTGNMKNDGYRTKKSIRNILDKKLSKGYNVSWRVRDNDGNIIGYVKGYNNEGFIFKVNRDMPNANKINFVLGHPFIKDTFTITFKVLWRHKINEYIDEIGLLIQEENTEVLNKLMEQLQIFYPNQLDTIGKI